MTQVAIVIPAAGSSSRMRGPDKLLEKVDGIPILQRVARQACATSSAVIVTLQNLTHPRQAVLSDLDVSIVPVPDASEGMSASLRTASRALPKEIDGVMILPADMPEITVEDLKTVMTEFSRTGCSTITQATGNDGTPGHPVVFPSCVTPEFLALKGDEGARSIVRRHKDRLHRIALPGCHALTDLDTPEDWANWRAANPDR